MTHQGAIFDVDGVSVDSPHELAWREGLKELMEGEWRDISGETSWTRERFTPEVYQQVMAGMPRVAGARAALEYFGVPDVDQRAGRYGEAKQVHVLHLHRRRPVHGFPGCAAVHPCRQGQRTSCGCGVVVEERQALPRADPLGHFRRRATS